MKIASIETREYRFRSTRRCTPPGTREPRTHQDATLVLVTADDGMPRLRQRRRAPRRRACSSGCWRGSTRSAPRSCARCARPSTSTAAGRGRSRWRCGISSAGRSGEPLWRLLGRPQRVAVAYASSAERVAGRRAGAAAASRCATRAFAPSSCASTTTTGAATSRWWRRCATRSAPEMRDHGRREPGLADARRPHAALGRRRPRSRAPGRSSRSASSGSRSRCAPTTSTATRPCGGRRRCGIAAGEMVREAAQARDLVVRGGVDVIQPDVVLAGGIGGARRVAALADLHGRMWSPHTWSNGYGLVANLHAALAFSTCPLRRGAVRPAGVDGGSGATGCCPAPVEIAADGTIRPPAGPGARRRARPGRARAPQGGMSGAADRDPGGGARAPRPAGAGRAAAAAPAPGTTRCSCAWPLPACATPTCTSPRATWATAAGRSCSGTRAPASSRRSARASPTCARATAVAFCFVPPCGVVPDVPRAAGRTCASRRPSTRSPGC